MLACAELVGSGKFEPSEPAQLLAAAYKRLHFHRRRDDSDSGAIVGSSTACVVTLEKSTNLLHTANLGDSGFVVMRAGRVFFRSEEQTHYFNAPFQLALPPIIDQQNVNFLGDSPDVADTNSFLTQEGDIILLATDGLFDNLSEELIVKELAGLQDDGSITETRVQEVCNSLALQARRLAYDEQHMSPFEIKARQQGIDAPGGKPDDITVLLVVVTS